ncbi:MAG: M4 family metallopeptidase [Saprospiraceae bacterium]|nr:M4 family metallopeptidase [Saprospiraceae bacterium]
MSRTIFTSLILLCSLALWGQKKPHLNDIPKSEKNYGIEDIQPLQPLHISAPAAKPNILQSNLQGYGGLAPLQRHIFNGSLMAIKDQSTGLPIYIKGIVKSIGSDKPLPEQAIAYLESAQELMQIKNATEEFKIMNMESDQLGQTHIRAQQYYRGIEVYNGEVMLHAQENQIQMLNGRYYPTPDLNDVTSRISRDNAIEIVFQHIGKTIKIKQLNDFEQALIDGKQAEARLVIYHVDQDSQAERLAWAITVHPNIMHRWAYFIDAKTGKILHHFSELCKFYHDHHPHKPELPTSNVQLSTSYSPLPPRTATAKDLFNIDRTFGTWLEGSTHYLIDASRNMFNSTQSSFPDDPVGVIWTIDGQNTSPANDDFAANHIQSTNNTWSNRTSVSAHYNAGKAYEYFENTFQRNSINGQGGNIISLINIVDDDGSAMDNAFWNGAAMFYGNGNQAFTAPLAKALDVGGHEMSHGVVQNTANLEYQGESGAMNESFADIFGAMIDRDDWQMGEDISNPQIFPSGALRDLSNPHNGGNSLNDNGWQPAHVSEQYRGNQDNGGVHINSGITNRAYYLFATAIGKNKAEQIFYRALTAYLLRSSKFVDLRIAVLQAATDLHGANSAEVTAAGNAFTTVGITGTQGTDTQTDVGANAGDEFILYSNGEQSSLSIVTPSGGAIANPLTTVGTLSKPSITDDGSIIVYVANDQTIRFIQINWAQGTASSGNLSTQTIWRNAVISKDGLRLAALTDDYDNKIFVFDLDSGEGVEYQLFNPTFVEGVSTGDVVYADALEWDISGEFLMYDALSVIKNAADSIEYWDIGFLGAWDNAANDFGDGFIQKLFSGLPENISVGNPTFSKNSPYIIAFDYLDFFNEEYAILGANTETGDVGGIYENSDLSFPNYSVDDSKIIFDGFVSFFNDRVVGVVDLDNDKINASTDPPTASVLIEGDASGARWGAWFANGDRVLSDNEELNLFDQSLEIFPNPFEEILYLRGELKQETSVQIEVFDQLGRRLQSSVLQGVANKWQETLSMRNLPAGAYVIRVSAGTNSASRKVVKLK